MTDYFGVSVEVILKAILDSFAGYLLNSTEENSSSRLQTNANNLVCLKLNVCWSACWNILIVPVFEDHKHAANILLMSYT